jgi:uncharacterized membrane protein
MKRDAAMDKVLSLTLKIGAYSAFACIATGLALHFVVDVADKITVTGFKILLGTPGLRIIVAGIQFLREREFKYVLVSLGVLTVMVLAYALGIQT